jgi:hypothetical protein
MLEEGYYVIAIVGIIVSKTPDLKHVQPPYEYLLHVFQCLTKLCQPTLILYGISAIKMAFKCLDHDTRMLLYLTCDPGGVLYDWYGLLLKLPLDQCCQFGNSYMKASKVNWLKSDCMLWVCMKAVCRPR